MIVLQARRDEVLAALQAVAGIVERRQTLPVLANVMIRKTGPTLELTTSDLEVQLRTRAELGGDAGIFATTVNARKLTDILRAMPAGQPVTLAASGHKLTLKGGGSRFTLHTLPADDFPVAGAAIDLGTAFAVPQAALRRLIEQVSFAMAVQDIRYFLNGVLFMTQGPTLRLVATDGNRLALAEWTSEVPLPACEVILPRKVVHELQRQLRDELPAADDGAAATAAPPVEMRFSAAQARFTLNGVEFVTKLVEGRFPDFNRVIPRHNAQVALLDCEPLRAGLQSVAILTTDKFRGIRVALAPGALRIASSNAEQEQADVDLEADYAGEPIEIGFNVQYLLDLLAQAGSGRVAMALQDARTSVLFTFPGRDGFKYVVSPMRL